MEEDNHEIEELFATADRDHNGTIEISELRRIMVQLSGNVSDDATVFRVFEAMGGNAGQGGITLENFRISLRSWFHQIYVVSSPGGNKRILEAPEAVSNSKKKQNSIMEFFEQFTMAANPTEEYQRLKRTRSRAVLDMGALRDGLKLKRE